MEMFIDMKGVPTRIGDRVSTEKGIGVVNDITPTGVNVLLNSAEYPERFSHDGVRRLIQKENSLEIAIEMLRGLVESMEDSIEAEKEIERRKEEEGVDNRSLFYTRGKLTAFRRTTSYVWNTLRALSRLEAGQDF